MSTELESKKERNYKLMRSIYDYAMGIIYIGVGAVIIFADYIQQDWIQFDPVFRYIFGGICWLYGGWRLYRGIQKDY